MLESDLFCPQVHPLRLSKETPTSSPTKVARAIPRPLSELSPTERRRNSPSWNQTSKVRHHVPITNDYARLLIAFHRR